MSILNGYISSFDGNHPGIPLQFAGVLEAALGLESRRQQMLPALNGCSNTYTLAGQSRQARDFLFGSQDDPAPDRVWHGLQQIVDLATGRRADQAADLFKDPINRFKRLPDRSDLTKLPLEQASDFSMSLTTYQNAYANAQPLLPSFEATLTDAQSATDAFWPTIAGAGVAYNPLVLKKVGPATLARLKDIFGQQWQAGWESTPQATLYAIDLQIFEQFPAPVVDNNIRFTPSTVTLLHQDPSTRKLTPFAVRVAGENASGATVFVRGQASESAWLYALQAAKTSVTVYGIWLGHVYHWHIPTSTMLKAMANNLATNHPVYRLVGPQSHHLIEFDLVLFALWGNIAPPTSFDEVNTFLELLDAFSADRGFLDDDPWMELENNGISEADFTSSQPWDRFPIVQHYLDVWSATIAYIAAFVDNTYSDDASVAGDWALQKWQEECQQSDKGNLRGLPQLTTRAALKTVLTSLIYRLTMHGATRLRKSLSPTLSWTANFPPCLQKEEIPSPQAQITPGELLQYLPYTGTIGQMTRFYDIFIYSAPYEPFIPVEGIDANLFFPENPDGPRNSALIQFRKDIQAVQSRIQPDLDQPHQWPLCIET